MKINKNHWKNGENHGVFIDNSSHTMYVPLFFSVSWGIFIALPIKLMSRADYYLIIKTID